MQKQELREAAGISRASMAKLAKNENVTTDVLAKVCAALDCDIADIAEFRRDTSEIPGIESNSSEITYRVNSFLRVLVDLMLVLKNMALEPLYCAR